MTDASPPFTRALRTCTLLTSAALLTLVAALALRADPIPILLAVLAALVLVPVTLVLAYARLASRLVPAPHAALTAGGVAAVLTLAGLYALGVAAMDRRLAADGFAGAYADCHKLWATRGLVAPGLSGDATAGNDAAALTAAFARGAPGVEVDVYYDPQLADFVVSHDFPYRRRDGQLLMLEALLADSDPSKHFWLDFKRHQKLSSAQAEAAAARLAVLAARSGIARERLWIEGTEPFNLMPFVHAGFSTIFDVHPPRDGHPLQPLATELHKAVFVLGGFTVMGMNFGTEADPIYGPRATARLGPIPLFLYHVPTDRALLARLAASSRVRVLLPGDHSADLFDIDACGASGATGEHDR